MTNQSVREADRPTSGMRALPTPKNALPETNADREQFRRGMRSLAGAVNIITSMHGGHRFGMTATAVCSATADPPTILVCINKLTVTHAAVVKSRVFCVNVLRSEHWDLSTAFSGAQTGEGRFAMREWTQLATGSPVLVDALVSFDCRVLRRFSHGTHSLFLGAVERIMLGKKGKPLLYSEGQYARLVALTHIEPLPDWLEHWGF